MRSITTTPFFILSLVAILFISCQHVARDKSDSASEEVTEAGYLAAGEGGNTSDAENANTTASKSMAATKASQTFKEEALSRAPSKASEPSLWRALCRTDIAVAMPTSGRMTTPEDHIHKNYRPYLPPSLR